MASSLSPSPPVIFSASSAKPHHQSHNLHLPFCSRKIHSLFIARTVDNGADTTKSAAAVEKNLEENEMVVSLKTSASQDQVPGFKDPRWIAGTWDLKHFQMGGHTDWDAVIDAEARRRKWLEDNPEASSNDAPVIFDTSIIPWWAWIKRYHLPEAENLNAGRAAMIGFFMAYLVDSLTGIGIVHQTGNFFCKTLLFIYVVILLIRNNEGIEKLKMIIEETTLYNKQWQATWKDDRLSQK